MSDSPERLVRDPEFHTPQARARLGSRASGPRWFGFNPQDYQRLVANPFLAVAFLLGWLAAAPWLMVGRSAGWIVPTFMSLIAIRYLLHYHCLDCGATGRLGTWREHRCAAVQLRYEAEQIRWNHGPTPGVQSCLLSAGYVVTVILAYIWYMAN